MALKLMRYPRHSYVISCRWKRYSHESGPHHNTSGCDEKEQAGGKCSRLVYQLNALFSLLHFPSMSLVFEHMDAQRDWQMSYFRPARLPSAVAQFRPWMSAMRFSLSITDRYFEDYLEGDVHRFGPIAVETDEVVSFAKRFDPQTMIPIPRRRSTRPSAASSPADGTPPP